VYASPPSAQTGIQMEIKINKSSIEVGDMVKVLTHGMSPKGSKDRFGIVERMECRPTIIIGENESVTVKNTIWTFYVRNAGRMVTENEHFVVLVQSKWHMYEAPLTVDELWVLQILYNEDCDLHFDDSNDELENLQELGYAHGIRFDGPRAWSITSRGKSYIRRGHDSTGD
jgi:hypothetical protein